MKKTLANIFAEKHDAEERRPYNIALVLISLALLSIGFIMVTSASMPEGVRLFDNPYHFAIRHLIYIALAFIAAVITLNLPMAFWRMGNVYLLLLATALLVAVLIIGREVNGSTRWLVIGPITVQAAEPAKLFFFCYLAGYLVRRHEQVTENLKGFIKPLIVFFVLAFLLLMQPDLGTVVVMFMTTLALLFLAGARLWQFFALGFTGIAAFVLLIVYSDYRKKRLMSFWDPWADPFGTGYQLTQSLMAFGRGSWFGQGLGNSVQKLNFLPEAHNDFIMAIVAEELGFIGIFIILALLLSLVVIALKIGNNALQNDKPFEGFLAYGIGIWFSFQTAVNLGAATGMLPTKGLTIPLVSYGGSSLIIMAVAVAILLRIDFELRVSGIQAMLKNPRKRRKRKAANESMEEASA
ncbi:MAG: cell division protein FtsW [Pseudomonadota bacterium]